MNHTELLAIANEAARRAVDHINSFGSLSVSDIDQKSSPTDLVTKVDRQTEAIIYEYLMEARPHDGFLGEETGRSGAGEVTWVVDPIDGTTNFVYGFPAYGVSIAAKEGDRHLCSVVVDVYRKEYFTATFGGGAFLNGKRLSIRPYQPLSQSLVATGFSYDAGRRVEQVQALAKMISSIRDIRRAGAASLDLAWLAAARTDAYYESGLKPWDFEGGTLIAREAGATVASFSGPNPSEEMTIACHPLAFDELRSLIEHAFEISDK